ncbi:VOC family protein [Paenibacillus sp. R14(2021)]|uniref:VOC family protein n=1 Tax=Paenibacillus sp. R14(2021) TaxID=2859228 RepID=UPI001C615D07|nr:VOC family protein [Paenibacillus sp. R14(2021)]
MEGSREMLGNVLRSICSVYVPVRNAARSVAWWQRNFGLELAVPQNPTILKLAEGQWLHLIETGGEIDNQFPDKSGYAMFRFTFEVRGIEHVYERLQSNGVRTEELKDRDWCGINFVFYDPDGNKFDVNEAVRAHRTPEEAEALIARLFHPVG